ncbi:MBL fold metallo-hydrolase [Nocardia terpenica]|uniref:MBL fold metallo-hydrolase n=1 Tax=Nocardia terpenica TaxID=455432 RepID=A0A6G9ZDD2_9NOCA|nr:MBL fold metallo-hydrolase [Nocardia terpenica]QIS23625.1 MBL fold metallo-hydrolase [Nocardia terpenica]
MSIDIHTPARGSVGPGCYQRPGTVHTLTVDDVRISTVPDGYIRVPPRTWLPDAPPEYWAANPHFLDQDGALVVSICALLVEHRDSGRALLIDAGVALPSSQTPYGTMRGGALLSGLAALGRSPADIEAVVITHLHADHLGWLWLPAPDGHPFAHARVYVGEREWAARREVSHRHGIPPEILDSFAPQVVTVTHGHQIWPEVEITELPGHSIGHLGVTITLGLRTLIVLGDAMTSPCQISHPEWGTVSDHHPAQATVSRRRLIAELVRPYVLAYAGHFADAQVGEVVPAGLDGYRWRPL